MGQNEKSRRLDPFISHAHTLKTDIATKTNNHTLLYVYKHETSTTDKGAERGSTLLANQHRGYEHCVQGEQNDLQAKRMSLFIASIIRLQATSVTPCQTKFRCLCCNKLC